MNDYEIKYLKYKNKYINYKNYLNNNNNNQIGGAYENYILLIQTYQNQKKVYLKKMKKMIYIYFLIKIQKKLSVL